MLYFGTFELRMEKTLQLRFVFARDYDRLNMVVVPTEVIWKWQQYGNNATVILCLFPVPSKMFFNLSANNPVTGTDINVTFNEMLFEQSVTSSTNNECPPKSGKADFVGLIKFR